MFLNLLPLTLHISKRIFFLLPLSALLSHLWAENAVGEIEKWDSARYVTWDDTTISKLGDKITQCLDGKTCQVSPKNGEKHEIAKMVRALLWNRLFECYKTGGIAAHTHVIPSSVKEVPPYLKQHLETLNKLETAIANLMKNKKTKDDQTLLNLLNERTGEYRTGHYIEETIMKFQEERTLKDTLFLGGGVYLITNLPPSAHSNGATEYTPSLLLGNYLFLDNFSNFGGLKEEDESHPSQTATHELFQETGQFVKVHPLFLQIQGIRSRTDVRNRRPFYNYFLSINSLPAETFDAYPLRMKGDFHYDYRLSHALEMEIPQNHPLIDDPYYKCMKDIHDSVEKAFFEWVPLDSLNSTSQKITKTRKDSTQLSYTETHAIRPDMLPSFTPDGIENAKKAVNAPALTLTETPPSENLKENAYKFINLKAIREAAKSSDDTNFINLPALKAAAAVTEASGIVGLKTLIKNLLLAALPQKTPTDYLTSIGERFIDPFSQWLDNSDSTKLSVKVFNPKAKFNTELADLKTAKHIFSYLSDGLIKECVAHCLPRESAHHAKFEANIKKHRDFILNFAETKHLRRLRHLLSFVQKGDIVIFDLNKTLLFQKGVDSEAKSAPNSFLTEPDAIDVLDRLIFRDAKIYSITALTPEISSTVNSFFASYGSPFHTLNATVDDIKSYHSDAKTTKIEKGIFYGQIIEGGSNHNKWDKGIMLDVLMKILKKKDNTPVKRVIFVDDKDYNCNAVLKKLWELGLEGTVFHYQPKWNELHGKESKAYKVSLTP